jgi:ribonuclease HII
MKKPASSSKPNPAQGPDDRYERAWMARDFHAVAGVDEVGRGPLAGPVVAAAVILDLSAVPAGLDDSKALNARKRDLLYPQIMAQARAVSVASVPAGVIDRINIRQATLRAMALALAGLSVKPDAMLVDGRDLPAFPIEGEAVIGGDAKVLSIAAASIIAKVVRDRMMAQLDRHYPVYGFAAHAGYGTARHLAALKAHGPCPHHRLSFAPLRQDLIEGL